MAALCYRVMFVLLASSSAVLSISIVNMAVTPENVRYSFEPYMETFSEFKTIHGKTYKTERDEAYRYSVFVENVKRMEDHNRKYQKGETTFYMNVNQFSDMTLEEYTAYNKLGRFSKSRFLDPPVTCPLYVPKRSSPQSIDWRDKGAVTPVKNQLECGSCWTFSATGAIEGQNFINTGILRSFSEQQILDCCQDLFCDNCGGGYPEAAFKFINRTGGLELETDYPYNGNDGYPNVCNYTISKAKVEVTACYDVPYGEEAALQDVVGNVGPVSVIIDANHESFRSYAGGIYDEPACATNVPAHAILVVGYGTSNGTDYWIVKNSWGVKWGMKGYILMRRNHKNMCGIASIASFPVTALPNKLGCVSQN